jgi:lipid-A-disaccharide synthase
MMTIFPFEPPVYDGTGLDVEFVGHPLLEVLAEERDESIERDPNTILLLPGSRSGEIKRILPTIAETACLLSRERPGLRFVLPTPRESTANRVRHLLASLPHAPEVQVEIGNARRWMQEAGTGIAASGTVTVEAAILGLPLVSVYRMNPITCALAALIVQLPYFTMVNLIAGKEVFPELLQGEFTPENTLAALRPLLPDGEKRAEVEQGMRDVIEALGGQRGASRRAATSVLEVATRG